MSPRDAVYYLGLFAGIIVGAVTMRTLGFPWIVQMIVGLVVGVGFGFLAEKIYSGGRPE